MRGRDPAPLPFAPQRLTAGYYASLEMFIADAKRMFQNARFYNAKDTVYYKNATKLEAWFDSWLDSRLCFVDNSTRGTGGV